MRTIALSRTLDYHPQRNDAIMAYIFIWSAALRFIQILLENSVPKTRMSTLVNNQHEEGFIKYNAIAVSLFVEINLPLIYLFASRGWQIDFILM